MASLVLLLSEIVRHEKIDNLMSLPNSPPSASDPPSSATDRAAGKPARSLQSPCKNYAEAQFQEDLPRLSFVAVYGFETETLPHIPPAIAPILPKLPPAKAPVKPPTLPPLKPPAKAPSPPPAKAPTPPPAKAPSPPPAKAPSPPPVKPPQIYPPKKVAVQGVVFCKACKFRGINTLMGASPLAGAVVKLVCNNTKTSLVEQTKTDKKGYFFFMPPKLTTAGYRKCRAYLVSSPSAKCSVPTNLHGGATGAILIPSVVPPVKTPKKTPPFSLFTVGPFAFEPHKKLPCHY
ncbi:hypothetical protein DH2020_032826 [Rehmannia glutinosa]|uniref:Pistil-specific extensin-like protein n=1 Tax=Rehmannia glutinosa TaxID=99300 RepID=A0ABR0VGR7_REHGL